MKRIILLSLTAVLLAGCRGDQLLDPQEIDAKKGSLPPETAIQAQINNLIHGIFPQPAKREGNQRFAQIKRAVASGDTEAARLLANQFGFFALSNTPDETDQTKADVTELMRLMLIFVGAVDESVEDFAIEIVEVTAGGECEAVTIVTTEGSAVLSIPDTPCGSAPPPGAQSAAGAQTATGTKILIKVTKPCVDANMNPEELPLDLPLFDDCIQIEAFDEDGEQIELQFTDLNNLPILSLCNNTEIEGLSGDQQKLVTLHQLTRAGIMSALPHVGDNCDEPTGPKQLGKLGSNPVVRFARAGWNAVRGWLGPEPLHAAFRRGDFGPAGALGSFSKFQFALPAEMTPLAGTDGQTAGPGTPVPVPPGVHVTDSLGGDVSGATVTFTVTLGGGTVTPFSVTTGANGIAQVTSWELGPAAPTVQVTNRLEASGRGIADPADGGPFVPVAPDFEPVVVQTGIVEFNATAENRVLVYGPSMLAPSTFGPDNEQTFAEDEGFTVTVADAFTWGNLTTAEFASFNAIVFGDQPGDVLGAADANKVDWSAAITGPVIISALNPGIHQCDLTNTNCLVVGPQVGGAIVHRPEAVTLIKNAINFAASGAGTGAYISLDTHFDAATPNTEVAFLSEIGTFEVVGFGDGFSDAITIVAPPGHPVITTGTGLTDAGLSNWFASAHQFLQVFPTSYVELAQGERITLVGEAEEAEPIIEPVSGFFGFGAGDADDFVVQENLDLRPFGSFSQTVTSSHATSQLDVSVTNGDGSALIALTHLMNIDEGGSQSFLSFAIQFDLLQEATYEIFGGLSGSFSGSPDVFVQLETSVQFDAFSPFTVLFGEGDNSIDISPVTVNFTMNGVNEGTIGGGAVSLGSRTGVLAAGRYGFDGTSSISSRGVGFSATGRTDLSIRLTPTGSTPPEVSETLAVIIACSPVGVTVCVVPCGGGGAPSPDASFDIAGGQSSSLSKVKVPKNIR